MSVTFARPLTCLIAIASLAACASTPRYTNSAGDVDLTAYPPARLSASEVQIIRGMSDANILGHLVTLDSLEVAAADSAVRFSKSDDVLAYAKRMHIEHTGDLNKEKDLAQQTGVGQTIDVTGLRASHIAAMIDSVRIASDATVDKHYVLSQIALHRHALAELEQLQSVARHQAIRAHIAEMIPVVQDHLARAHAIAATLGYEKKS